MTTETLEVTAESVIRANRDYYADRAATYDREEQCASDPETRELLASVLSRALVLCANREDPAILDACGGSGNVSEILAGLGYRTVVVDVSPDMLDLWRGKAAALGIADPEVVESDAESFLERDPRSWDLIVFSSAMHHLDDYAAVASKAVSRLAPGGVVVTVFDPTSAGGRVDRLLRRLDWVLPAAARHPIEMAGTALRKAKGAAGSAEESSTGALAERHAVSGVDETRLTAAIETAGAEVLVHERYSFTKLYAIEVAFRLLRTPSSFHLIARKRLNDDRN